MATNTIFKPHILKPCEAERPAAYADRVGRSLAVLTTTEHKRRFGQCLTPLQVADFMAGTCALGGNRLRVLDPGAGVGHLSCALLESLAGQNAGPLEIELIAYESDTHLTEHLTGCLEYARRWLQARKVELRYEVRSADFILTHAQALDSPRAHYALSEAALAVVRKYGTSRWKSAARRFLGSQKSLLTVYQQSRAVHIVPVQLADGTSLELSPGKHNQLQAAVVEFFAPRFAAGAQLLYPGDTAKKNLYVDAAQLSGLGIALTEHDKLPDVVLYDSERDWLFLIEAVTSHGPVTPKRVIELETMFGKCAAGRVYVSAFPDFTEFRRHLKAIAWETEVWIAEIPKHLIHFNGDKFLGPR